MHHPIARSVACIALLVAAMPAPAQPKPEGFLCCNLRTDGSWISDVAEDPRSRLAGFPARMREAIQASRVAKGMSKEQVLMAVGYPVSSENPTLDAPLWRYWLSSFSEFQVLWDDKGRVKDIVTDPQTRNLVVAD